MDLQTAPKTHMSKLFSIQDKVIVLSGATGVLGAALANYLANEGAQMVILGRSPEKVNGLTAHIKASGGRALPAVADVTVEAQLVIVKERLLATFGHIDVLINAAGGNMPGATIKPDQNIFGCSTQALKEVMELNYLGTFLPIKVLSSLFLDKRRGSIINISSMSAHRPLTRVMGYSSAKAAINNLTQWMAVEFAQKYGAGIRVNAIAPGFFLTEQNKTLLTKEDGSLTERGAQIIQQTPMGRFGTSDELLGTLHWLCSDASKFVTGTIVPVDGGFGAYSGV